LYREAINRDCKTAYRLIPKLDDPFAAPRNELVALLPIRVRDRYSSPDDDFWVPEVPFYSRKVSDVIYEDLDVGLGMAFFERFGKVDIDLSGNLLWLDEFHDTSDGLRARRWNGGM